MTREGAMRQVIFSRMRPAGGRWNVSGCGYACRTMIGASPGCRGQWGAACDPSRQSGLRAELPPVPHHHRPGPPRVADSPARDAIPQFDAHRLECRMVLPRPSAPPRRAVTLALHARNAKKNFSRTMSINSSIVRNSACNACKTDSIFSENASVSYAVDSSIDRMMLSRNRTTDFPYWPNFVGVLASVTTRGQGVQLPRAGHRGTP